MTTELTAAEHRKLVIASLHALAEHIQHTPEIVGFELIWRGGDNFEQNLKVQPAKPAEFIPISFLVDPPKAHD